MNIRDELRAAVDAFSSLTVGAARFAMTQLSEEAQRQLNAKAKLLGSNVAMSSTPANDKLAEATGKAQKPQEARTSNGFTKK